MKQLAGVERGHAVAAEHELLTEALGAEQVVREYPLEKGAS